MPRVVLVLPTSTYRAEDFVRAAAAVGAEVVVASERRQALAGLMRDRALTIRLDNPELAARSIVELHDRAPVDAVVAVDDQGVLIGALAAAALGLPHNPPDAVITTRDKAEMRRRLARAGVPQPAFEVLQGPPTLGYPLVLKPVSLSGSRGVIRADDAAEAAEAVRRIRAIAPDGPLLAERFAAGPEIAVEGLLRAGRLEVLATFDKPDPLDGPFFEETIYVTPSRLPAGLLADAHRTTAAAAAALGLREGPVHAELRLTTDGPSVIEIAARSIGGLCGRTLRFGAGLSLEQVILRHALGLPLDDLDDLARERAAAGVMMLPIREAGTLREVRGQDAARAVRGVAGLEITIHPGKPVTPLPEGDRYLGFLFARGDTPEEVEATLRKAHAVLEVDICASS